VPGISNLVPSEPDPQRTIQLERRLQVCEDPPTRPLAPPCRSLHLMKAILTRICQRLQEGFPHRLIQINVCSAEERALPGRAMFPHGAWFFEL
jgi:hypothetical protein